MEFSYEHDSVNNVYWPDTDLMSKDGLGTIGKENTITVNFEKQFFTADDYGVYFSNPDHMLVRMPDADAGLQIIVWDKFSKTGTLIYSGKQLCGAFQEDVWDTLVLPYLDQARKEASRVINGFAISQERIRREMTSTEHLAKLFRQNRDDRLRFIDWTRNADLSEQLQQKIEIYRQNLKDMPALPGFPWKGGTPDDDICPWPTLPELNIDRTGE